MWHLQNAARPGKSLHCQGHSFAQPTGDDQGADRSHCPFKCPSPHFWPRRPCVQFEWYWRLAPSSRAKRHIMSLGGPQSTAAAGEAVRGVVGHAMVMAGSPAAVARIGSRAAGSSTSACSISNMRDIHSLILATGVMTVRAIVAEPAMLGHDIDSSCSAAALAVHSDQRLRWRRL